MPAPSERNFLLAIFDHPFWGRGFRPFFFFGTLYTIIGIILWGGFYAGHLPMLLSAFDPLLWHAHEMIYGFTMAIVAGFLLTAVANWTGGAPARQMHLAALCALWIAGRVVMAFDMGLPLWLVFAIESAFVPALAASLAIPLIRSWNKRNFVFLGLLGILFACDLWFLIGQTTIPLHVAIMMIVVMISLIGGRIIPAFTVAALRRRGEEAYQTDQRKMDVAALLSLAGVVAALLLSGPQGLPLAIAGVVAAVIHALRMRYYHTSRVFNDPMLWILHAGYAWVVVGLVMVALAGWGSVPISTALHALTAGAIGSMILGMICRVTLGHTGRELKASPLTVIAFVLIQLAAVIRVFAPLAWPDHMVTWIAASACLWAISFALYLPVYAPMLWKPRPDGLPA